LRKENLVEVVNGLATVASNSRTQQLRRIHILAMAHGIDPERLLQNSSLNVWRNIGESATLSGLAEKTGLSYPMVRKIVNLFRSAELVSETRLKPLKVEKAREHPVSQVLESYLKEPTPPVELPYPGRLPSRRLAGTPTTTGILLHDELEKGISLGGRGWSWSYGAGDESIDVTSILENLGREDIFLEQLKTLNGAQEFCLHMLAAWDLDHDRLLELSKKEDFVNQVGCWLDLARRFAPDLVKYDVVEKFLQHRSGRLRTFPEGVKTRTREPKPKWVRGYEKKWNVSLRLSVAALAQEARNL
ncbi:MAG: hypothetical protein U9M97_04625, partial [Candidatus Hadarchaeota archaeon]|nr:hypothetical protein [Candidatus Hadarchaeota archaeon]